MRVEAPVGDVDDAVLVEHAIALRAVNALNEELLASQQPLRLGAADRALGEGRRRSDEKGGERGEACEDKLRTGFAIFDTP